MSVTIEKSTRATIVCDGPRCAARNNTESPLSFSFVEEEVAKDERKFPEIGDNFIPLAALPPRSPSNRPNNNWSFCGPQCIRDFFQYTYICPPPRPKPEERAEELKDLNPHLVQNITPTALSPEVVKALNGQQKITVETLRAGVDQLTGPNTVPRDELPSAADLDLAVKEGLVAVSGPDGFSGFDTDHLPAGSH